MKRTFITAIAFAVLVACNNSADKDKDNTSNQGDAKTEETDITSLPEYQEGLDLISKSDCLTCHKVDERLTGPSYKEVAQKYASQGSAAVPGLAEKIVKGGSGVWGDVPMLPHPNISQEDAEKMVKYILLLK